MSSDALMDEAFGWEKNLLNFFRRMGVSYDESEDMVQETYLRLWKYRRRYERTAKLSTFLFIIARQVRLDALRRESRRGEREKKWSEEAPRTAGPSVPAANDLAWALSRLSQPLRDVVELGYFQDLPYAEIAAILEIPAGTVKSRMSNALKKLKEIMDERGS